MSVPTLKYPIVFVLIAILALVLGIVLRNSTGNVSPPSPSNSPSPTVTIVDKTILFDTFTQAGVGSIPLSQHTPEIGGPWTAYNIFPELDLILGEGYCTNNSLTIDINQSCVCQYDNKQDTLNFTLHFVIPSTITIAGDVAGMAAGFVTSIANGFSVQFFYDPTAQTYAIQLVQLTGGMPDLILPSKTINSQPPIDQTIIMTGVMKPAGGFIVSVLDAEVSGQGIYSPMVDDFNEFVCAMFRGNPVETANIRMEEILIKAI